ncbi:hypothetical protein NLM26_33970, partial [Streptomyces drozdowiczii]|nr:hypothetical protein [Streptomyces drozdowiczii]
KTELSPCAIVNVGSIPFRGTTTCGPKTTVTVQKAATTSTNVSPSTSASTGAGTTSTSTGTTTSPASGMTAQRAETGSSDLSAPATLAAGLVAAGAGPVGFTAMRRRRNHA